MVRRTVPPSLDLSGVLRLIHKPEKTGRGSKV